LASFIYELGLSLHPFLVMWRVLLSFIFLCLFFFLFCSLQVYCCSVAGSLSPRYRACCIWRVAFNQLPGTLRPDFLTGHKSVVDQAPSHVPNFWLDLVASYELELPKLTVRALKQFDVFN